MHMDPIHRACLIVIDGWGINTDRSVEPYDAIKNSATPIMDAFLMHMPNATGTVLENGQQSTTGDVISCVPLTAHGLAVGLPDGLMGNSEVGHLNIGAGRVVYQDIVRIDKSIAENTFQHSLCNILSRPVPRIHLIGLVSDGGVHSHLTHLYALVKSLSTVDHQSPPEIFIHAITDGRDTSPSSAVTYLSALAEFLVHYPNARLATVMGRYYAMDRDKRWERTKLAYDALVSRKGECIVDDAIISTVQEKYNQGEFDEFLKPIIVGHTSSASAVCDNDVLLFFNFRSDRMRQLVTTFLPDRDLRLGSMPETGSTDPQHSLSPLPASLRLISMTQYNKEFNPYVSVLYPPQSMSNVLAEWLSINNTKQCHIAETEKYAHVTFFFNGGVETSFKDEGRVMIPSPKVATYDLQPEMSCLQVADSVCQKLADPKGYDFVMCNLAPPDMVGHTGSYEAAKIAVAKTDQAIGMIWEKCRELGIYLFITSDHGNAEKMTDPVTLKPHTAHTCNPVPFVLACPSACPGGALRLRVDEGQQKNAAALCDVAPTILSAMNLRIPKEMSGRSLL